MALLWKSFEEKSNKRKVLVQKDRNDEIYFMYDLHAAAWKLKSKGNLVVDTVGYLPKEILRAA